MGKKKGAKKKEKKPEKPKQKTKQVDILQQIEEREKEKDILTKLKDAKLERAKSERSKKGLEIEKERLKAGAIENNPNNIRILTNYTHNFIEEMRAKTTQYNNALDTLNFNIQNNNNLEYLNQFVIDRQQNNYEMVQRLLNIVNSFRGFEKSGVKEKEPLLYQEAKDQIDAMFNTFQQQYGASNIIDKVVYKNVYGDNNPGYIDPLTFLKTSETDVNDRTAAEGLQQRVARHTNEQKKRKYNLGEFGQNLEDTNYLYNQNNIEFLEHGKNKLNEYFDKDIYNDQLENLTGELYEEYNKISQEKTKLSQYHQNRANPWIFSSADSNTPASQLINMTYLQAKFDNARDITEDDVFNPAINYETYRGMESLVRPKTLPMGYDSQGGGTEINTYINLSSGEYQADNLDQEQFKAERSDIRHTGGRFAEHHRGVDLAKKYIGNPKFQIVPNADLRNTPNDGGVSTKDLIDKKDAVDIEGFSRGYTKIQLDENFIKSQSSQRQSGRYGRYYMNQRKNILLNKDTTHGSKEVRYLKKLKKAKKIVGEEKFNWYKKTWKKWGNSHKEFGDDYFKELKNKYFNTEDFSELVPEDFPDELGEDDYDWKANLHKLHIAKLLHSALQKRTEFEKMDRRIGKSDAFRMDDQRSYDDTGNLQDFELQNKYGDGNVGYNENLGEYGLYNIKNDIAHRDIEGNVFDDIITRSDSRKLAMYNSDRFRGTFTPLENAGKYTFMELIKDKDRQGLMDMNYHFYADLMGIDLEENEKTVGYSNQLYDDNNGQYLERQLKERDRAIMNYNGLMFNFKNDRLESKQMLKKVDILNSLERGYDNLNTLKDYLNYAGNPKFLSGYSKKGTLDKLAQGSPDTLYMREGSIGQTDMFVGSDYTSKDNPYTLQMVMNRIGIREIDKDLLTYENNLEKAKTNLERFEPQRFRDSGKNFIKFGKSKYDDLIDSINRKDIESLDGNELQKYVKDMLVSRVGHSDTEDSEVKIHNLAMFSGNFDNEFGSDNDEDLDKFSGKYNKIFPNTYSLYGESVIPLDYVYETYKQGEFHSPYMNYKYNYNRNYPLLGAPNEKDMKKIERKKGKQYSTEFLKVGLRTNIEAQLKNNGVNMEDLPETSRFKDEEGEFLQKIYRNVRPGYELFDELLFKLHDLKQTYSGYKHFEKYLEGSEFDERRTNEKIRDLKIVQEKAKVVQKQYELLEQTILDDYQRKVGILEGRIIETEQEKRAKDIEQKEREELRRLEQKGQAKQEKQQKREKEKTAIVGQKEKQQKRVEETLNNINSLELSNLTDNSKYLGGGTSNDLGEHIGGYLDSYINPLWNNATNSNIPLNQVIRNFLNDDDTNLDPTQIKKIREAKGRRVGNLLRGLTKDDISDSFRGLSNKQPINPFTGLSQEQTREQFGLWLGTQINEIGLGKKKAGKEIKGTNKYIQDEVKNILGHIGIDTKEQYEKVQNLYKNRDTTEINKDIYDRLNNAYGGYFPDTFLEHQHSNKDVGKKPMFKSPDEGVGAIFHFGDVSIDEHNLPVIYGKSTKQPAIYEPRMDSRGYYNNPEKAVVSYDYVNVGQDINGYSHLYGHTPDDDAADVNRLKPINLANPTMNPFTRQNSKEGESQDFNIGEVMNQQLIKDSRGLVGKIFEVSSNVKEGTRELTKDIPIGGKDIGAYGGFGKGGEGSVLHQTARYRQIGVRTGRRIAPQITTIGGKDRLIGRSLDLVLKRRKDFSQDPIN